MTDIQRFSRQANGDVANSHTGEVLQATFNFEGVSFWADVQAITTKFAVDETSGVVYRLKIIKGLVEGARLATTKERPEYEKECGLCVSERDITEMVGSEPFTVKGDLGGEGKQDAMILANVDIAPMNRDALGSLIVTGPDALITEKQPGVIVSKPIVFITLGTEDKKTGNIVNHPFRGIPLIRFKVPVWFGSPPEQKDDTESRERFAYYFLLTADGAVGSTTEEKGLILEAGEVVWVDEKWPLRGTSKHLPRVAADGSGRPVKATELLITPRGKGTFQRKVKKGNVETLEPGQRWRIESKWCRNISGQSYMNAILAMASLAPDIPFRPGDNVVDEMLVDDDKEVDKGF